MDIQGGKPLAIALSDIRIVLEIGSGLEQKVVEKLIGQMVSVAQNTSTNSAKQQQPCCDVDGCVDIADVHLCMKHFRSVNSVVKMPSL